MDCFEELCINRTMLSLDLRIIETQIHRGRSYAAKRLSPSTTSNSSAIRRETHEEVERIQPISPSSSINSFFSFIKLTFTIIPSIGRVGINRFYVRKSKDSSMRCNLNIEIFLRRKSQSTSLLFIFEQELRIEN